MNAEKERVAARQEQMMLRARAAEQKARSLRDQLDDMQDDQDEQMERVERLQERMNARMGR
jgi:hypothetical protein